MRYSIFEKITMIFIAICFIFVGLSAYFHFGIDRGIEVEVDFENQEYVHRQYNDMFDWLVGDVTEYTVPFDRSTSPKEHESEPIVDRPL